VITLDRSPAGARARAAAVGAKEKTMELRVDRDKCQGHGKCYLTAPALFQPDENDDWGRAVALQPVIDASHPKVIDLARHALTLCPEFAIELSGQ
jgi:ferredoxin